jgi:NNP family nitrate/nitrite transporter-like MFS transporter
MMVLAFLTGIGGGVFSGYMPSTSYFFPKSKQGTALGLQAGIGNFGVACVQLLTPIIVGWALFGPVKNIIRSAGKDAAPTWLASPAAFIFILLVIAAVLAFIFLKSVPIKANFRQQFDIFGNKHTWLMTLIYLLTFGCFSGLAGVFALMMTNMFPKMPTIAWLGGTAIAFLGAFIGSVSRVLWGPLCDKYGGGIWTLISSIGIAISAVIVIIALSGSVMNPLDPATGKPTLTGAAYCQVPQGLFLTGMFLLFFFAGVGNAATFKQMPMIFEPRQAGGVIGWTAAIAAFGPFIFSFTMNMLSGNAAIKNFGHAIIPVFVVVAILGVACAIIDWWYYTRPGAEAKS